MRPWFRNLHPWARMIVFIVFLPFVFIAHTVHNIFMGFGNAAYEIKSVWNEMKDSE